MAREDDFTSTVDGAAGFERRRDFEPYDDRPSLSDTGEGWRVWDEKDADEIGPEPPTDEERNLEEQLHVLLGQ